eukprot:832381-Prorocentrum_minimum.AAC.5
MCVPAAIAEIARVLKPGATYCGTTFLNPRIPFVDDEFQRLALSVLRQTSPLFPERTGLIKYWDKQELKVRPPCATALCRSLHLVPHM